ncbi:MAG: TonB C-terminal domain-containing protein [Muribaculaceae bacterium]|nr:TonB C-terminal domain-containing protein [Muribaculaceae bacterium]
MIKKFLTVVLGCILACGCINTAFAADSNANENTQSTAVKDNVDFGPYMREMQRRIKSNWNPPQDKFSRKVTLLYEIKKSGEVTNVSIVQSSGNKKMDKSAIKALEAASPLRPLPAEFKEDSVKVQFTFDYNVH